MKVVYIYGNIINCEEIRNVSFYKKIVTINYKNPADPADRTTIQCASEKDAKDVMDIIYNEMVGE